MCSSAEGSLQAAAVDEATRFRRLYKLADGAELLVTVRREDGEADEASDNGAESGGEGSGPTVVTLTTSSPNDLVLHWGVSKHDKAWVLPPKPLWKQVAGSMADAGGVALPWSRCDAPDEAGCMSSADSSADMGGLVCRFCHTGPLCWCSVLLRGMV